MQWRIGLIKLINWNMEHWLIKSEPEEFSFEDLEREGTTEWTGVRNYAARINLNNMRNGDICLFYHSVTDKRIVGLVTIVEEAYPDPTDETGKWVAVKVAYLKPLNKPIEYKVLKEMDHMKKFDLIRISRLSVMPVPDEFWYEILEMSETTV